MINGDLLDLYEEVADFSDSVASLIEDVPKFENKDYVERDLKDAKNMLDSWLGANEEWYKKQMKKEEFLRDAEFERGRL